MNTRWIAAFALAAAAAPVGALATPPQADPPAAPRFRSLLWRSEPKLDELTRAFGGMCVMRGEAALERELDEAGLDYLVFNAAGRDELHLDRERASWREPWDAWLRDRDPRHLRRAPCLASPTTREGLHATLRTVIGAKPGARGLGLSLGDEIGLTPGGIPHDVCQCEHCEAQFASWPGRATRPWLTVEGRALRLADISTDGACRALAHGDLAALGPWLARREFHQEQLLELVLELAQRARRDAPGAPIGLLGISGRTAFAGVAVERVLPQLDFLECYRVGDARELLFTLRAPRQAAWLTIFRDPRSPHGASLAAWEHWMRGGDGVVVWSDAELRAEPVLAERLRRTLARLDELRGELPAFRPRPVGVAVLHSARSLSAAWLREAVVDGATWPKRFPSWQEKHGAYETARNSWLALLEDCGAQPGSVPIEALDAGLAADFALLVASNWLVVEAEDLARLGRYLAAGGRLMVSGEFAWIDAAGRAHDAELLERLAAAHPGAVLRAEPTATRHSSARSDPDLVRRTTALLSQHGVELAPWRLVGEAPWISTWSTSGAETLGALLPKLAEGASWSWPERLTLSLEPDTDLEWLHPDPRTADAREQLVGGRRVGSLRPAEGDAVVLRLRRRRKP